MLEVLKSRKKMLLLILTNLLLLIATSIIYGKLNVKNKDALDFDLKKGVFLLHSYKGEIWLWDEPSNQFKMIVDLKLVHKQLLSISVDTGTQSIYALEGAGYAGGIALGNSQISNIAIQTGEQTVIFKKRNAFYMSVSNDMQFALVASFPLKATRPNLSEIEWCMLDIARKICGDLKSRGYTLKWLNSKMIFATDRKNSYLINVPEFDRTQLPLPLLDAVSIASTGQVLLSRADGGFGFLKLDLKTLDTEIYNTRDQYDPINSAFQNMTFSPDEKYFLFKNNNEFLIVDFASSKVIKQLDDLSFLAWLSNNTLVGLKFSTAGQYPVEIIRYNLSVDTTENLASYDEAITVTVVN